MKDEDLLAKADSFLSRHRNRHISDIPVLTDIVDLAPAPESGEHSTVVPAPAAGDAVQSDSELKPAPLHLSAAAEYLFNQFEKDLIKARTSPVERILERTLATFSIEIRQALVDEFRQAMREVVQQHPNRAAQAPSPPSEAGVTKQSVSKPLTE